MPSSTRFALSIFASHTRVLGCTLALVSIRFALEYSPSRTRSMYGVVGKATPISSGSRIFYYVLVHACCIMCGSRALLKAHTCHIPGGGQDHAHKHQYSYVVLGPSRHSRGLITSTNILSIVLLPLSPSNLLTSIPHCAHTPCTGW